MGDTRRRYERIAEKLRAKIASGIYPIGRQLPSERDLAQHFKVSRPTVREATITLQLAGLVEVRHGSGVHVIATVPKGGAPVVFDFGPFELLEARRAIEPEISALAAKRITPEQLSELISLVSEMRDKNERNVAQSEDAERRFHELIAESTGNSVLLATAKMLWDARQQSIQYKLWSRKLRAIGLKPRTDGYTRVIDALKLGDSTRARTAMRDNMARVIDELLKALEAEAVERASAEIAEKRRRYASTEDSA
jgi:DNA-binding FadR family transcriptional regulator